MGDLAAQLPIVLGMLAMLLVGPGVAVAFLILRKRRARVRRRSPIGIDLLRGPGHSLREQIDELTTDVMSDTYALMVMPLLMLAVFLVQAHLRGMSGMLHLIPVYVIAALAVVGWTIRRLIKSGERLDKLRVGYDAEVAVGQELDQLMRQGAAVFHDFPAENFNIDHVVVSRQGVFAVESKGCTKPGDLHGKAGATVVHDGQTLAFPRWTTREPLEQADRQAQWLGRWASKATGNTIHALPVLALPGWFVDRKGRGDVRVYSGKELASLLSARGTQPLSEEVMQRVVHQVEQRCRTVAPSYGISERQS